MFTYPANISAEKISLHEYNLSFYFLVFGWNLFPPPFFFFFKSKPYRSESDYLRVFPTLSDGSVYSFDKVMILLCSKQWSDSFSQGDFDLPENKNINHQLKYSDVMYVLKYSDVKLWQRLSWGLLATKETDYCHFKSLNLDFEVCI